MLKFLLPLAVGLGLVFLLTGVTAGVLACAGAAAYFTSLYVYPNRDCISCGGRKAHGPEGSHNFRRCLTCKGRGNYPRLGVRLFRRDVVQGIEAGKRGRFW